MLILTTGQFGVATSRLLSRTVEAVHVDLSPGDTVPVEALTGQTFVAAILWHGDHRLCEAIDAACWLKGLPWAAAWLDEAILFCGLLVCPGRGPCYGCFRRRSQTHQLAGDRWAAIEQARATQPAIGPPGFAPVAAWIAAAAVLDASEKCTRVQAAGRFRTVDLIDGSVLETRIVPVHGCARCGAPPTPDRFVRRLAPAVDALLS